MFLPNEGPVWPLLIAALALMVYAFGIHVISKRVAKKREKITRKMAAQLWCIHVHIDELIQGKKSVVVYKEKQLFDILKDFGYDVEYWIDNLDEQEILDACEQVRPDAIGVILLEENALEDEEEGDPKTFTITSKEDGGGDEGYPLSVDSPM